MYKILVVDDEPEVAEGLLDILDEIGRDDFELSISYSASEALGIMEHIKIDIVLTDIHMPEMDGLTMYDEIKKRWPRCKVIFISGVRNFDYIYQSVRNGDVRYLTKMEPDEKIRQTVLDVVREIEQNALLHNALQQAKQYYIQALPLLREQYIKSILEGTCQFQKIFQDMFDEFNIPLKVKDPVTFFGIRFDSSADSSETCFEEEKRYLLYSLQAICQDANQDFTSLFCCTVELPFLICILQFPLRSGVVDVRTMRDAIFEQIQKGCRTNLRHTVSIAYSSTPVMLPDLSASYSAIRHTLGYGQNRFNEGIWEAGALSGRRDNEPIPTAQALLRNFPALENSLELGDRDGFHQLLDEMTDCLKPLPKTQTAPTIEVYYKIATLLLKYINLWELGSTIDARIPLNRLLRSEDHRSWAEAVNYLSQVSDAIMDGSEENESEKYLDAIETVKQYIREHLHCDLSLTVLANQVHLHPSYLSRLFKEATKKNLNRYILELRMDLAKHLLCTSNEKIYVIAQRTGYVTTQTFNRAFKKFVGTPPNEYRAKRFGR